MIEDDTDDANVYRDARGERHIKPDAEPIHPRPSGYAWIMDHETGEVLVVKQVWGRVWSLPGGGIDEDEVDLDGAVRECREETGYDVRLDGTCVIAMRNNFYDDVTPGRAPRYCDAVVTVFRGRIVGERRPVEEVPPYAVEEVIEIAWKRPDDLRADGCDRILRAVLERMR